ncbi:AraC family transcriptional regulator [Kutzneria kofuensis]|uniref:AraC-like DNA-binding protein n=1 Tax=Kutzneria kofuensis TaxID=103725 RepID=A0A7W9KKZ8_9PSEU|nr:AraC family transcriptional regulator [Kutzneria kofuensis]MBB5894183.1 AraC-like DNA-binding protein [Kutzneria kofuensis]
MRTTLRELTERITRLHARGTRPVWIDGMTVNVRTSTVASTGGVMRPVLALVAQGAKQTTLADRVYDYRAGQYLVASLDLPVAGRITRASPAEPFVGLGLPLKKSIITQLLLETGGGGRADDDASSGIVTADADEELLDAVVRLLRLLDRPADFAVLGPGVEREIHWRLMNGPRGAAVRRIGMEDSRVSLVGRATEWISRHYDRTIRISDLADEVGVSVATLNRHFRAVTAMSPLQYQKNLRLQQARLRLIAAPDDVAAVGYAVGYDSPSQFSREYRRLFGEPPGRDVLRIQEDVEVGA